MKTPRIAVVVSGFPRRSETFMLGELLALEASGSLAALFATKPGEDGPYQPGCERLFKYLRVLPPGTAGEQANVIARTISKQSVAGIHAYFAHTPAAVAASAAHTLGLHYSFSVHARDARKEHRSTLAHRARKAACVIACNADVARELRETGVQISLIPHGVDLQRFRPSRNTNNGPLRLLAVGRLVEKKGFHVLLSALSAVLSPYKLRIVGDGPERERLLRLVQINKVEHRVTIEPAVTHTDLPRFYREADVGIVPSIQDQSGDRDGLPNVVLEAMASARPVIASDISAISTAVENEKSGILVPPGDQLALASAIDRMATSRAYCVELGRKARVCVERKFELGACSKRFQQLLTSVYA